MSSKVWGTRTLTRSCHAQLGAALLCLVLGTVTVLLAEEGLPSVVWS